jgi:Holliday junction resolvase RusA-like endonuclease
MSYRATPVASSTLVNSPLSAAPEAMLVETPSPLIRHIGAIDALPFDEPGNCIEFFVPGQPVAKARARTAPIYRRDGSVVMAANGRVVMSSHTPEKTVQYENRVAAAAHEAMAGIAPWTLPVAVDIEIGLEVPASWSEKKRRACYAQLIGATKKPDMDNIEKAVIDGMNAIVFDDDCRVVQKSTVKQYAATPGVVVKVRVLRMASA